VSLLAKWDGLMEVRADVLKELEGKRQAKFIGSPLEARVRLEGYALDDYAADLPGLFIVSQVILEPGDERRVIVERADGVKCERCWKYSTAVGDDLDFPTVCDSCSAALREMLG
jgi:isoleucyl-tRNA synthetase